MKKIAKLSLVAAVAVAGFTTSAMAADTIAEAFAASTIKGEIKSLYFQKELENGADAKSSIWTNGGNLSLKTGSFNGLMAGVTFQTAHIASLNDDLGNYNGDMNTSGSVMSEAYLAYTLANTTAKVGRQYISTPLVAGSGSRIFKQSFEGIVLVNTDLANTTLVASYVDKFQHRTSTAADKNIIGEEPEFAQVGDGAYTLYAKNTSIENLAIQAQYAVVKEASKTVGEDLEVAYIDAAYNFGPVEVAGQVFNSDNGNATNSDGALYGIKATGKIEGIKLTAAYTTTDDEADVVSGLGSGADSSFTASPINGGVYTADTDSYLIGLGYKFDMGLGLDASYTDWDNNSVGGFNTSETNVTASYAFNKNLSAKIMHSVFDTDETASTKAYDYRSRVYVSYTF